LTTCGERITNFSTTGSAELKRRNNGRNTYPTDPSYTVTFMFETGTQIKLEANLKETFRV
jgi:hypothetical protein